MDATFRTATGDDLTAICDVQIASWRRAYHGLLPNDFLCDPVARVLADRWSALPGAAWLVDTAWISDRLAGFISVDRARAGGAYVDNLHVAHWAQGNGLGRMLMGRAALDVARKGGSAMWLTVMRDNHPTRAFYARLGGIEGAEQTEMLYGHSVRTFPVRWEDLSELAGFAIPA